MQNLTKKQLAEAIQEILLSTPPDDRLKMSAAMCGQRVREEYGPFPAADFNTAWLNVRESLKMRDALP
jgi:hypothetical protein